MTLIECVSAIGDRLPAFYIYAGTAHYAGWHKEANGLDPDPVFAYTDNGWIDGYIGIEWLQIHFGKFALSSAPGRTRLLLCDNHSSHNTFEFYEHCLANSISLFFLPSHATHVLQPVDVGGFCIVPLDKYCSLEVDGWTSQPLHTPLAKADFFPMYERARGKHSHHKISGLHGASAVFTPSIGLESSATQELSTFPYPPRTTTSTRTSPS